MNINPRIAIVGATGMVGRTFLKVLEERQLRARDYVLFASGKSAGTELDFMYKKYVVQELREDSFDSGFDIALFSAGGGVSLKFAPLAASRGCVVIDNSSAWRMDPSVPLVVPEVNSEAIRQHRGIIANPNCNVIPATVALKPLYDATESGELSTPPIRLYPVPGGAAGTIWRTALGVSRPRSSLIP
jgi:aspartate-semialdehyde dehydrogenase